MTTWPAALRDKLLQPYRAERATPRAFGPGVSDYHRNTDPAPPWVPAVVDALLPRLADVSDHGAHVLEQLLAWCAAGDPVARAEQALMLVQLWPGSIHTMLVLFVTAATQTRAGRAACSKYKPIVPPSIPRNWPGCAL